MKMVRVDDIVEYCDTNIAYLAARRQGVACTQLRRVKEAAIKAAKKREQKRKARGAIGITEAVKAAEKLGISYGHYNSIAQKSAPSGAPESS